MYIGLRDDEDENEVCHCVERVELVNDHVSCV